MAIPVTFFMLWLEFPNISFLIFIFLSALHFGISDQSGENNKLYKFFEIFVRGFLVLSIPLEFHFYETNLIFNFLLAEESFIFELKKYNWICLFFIILFSIFLVANCLLKKKNMVMILEILIIFFCFFFFKPLVSFFLYFCLAG